LAKADGRALQRTGYALGEQMMNLNETPVYLLFNTAIDPLQKELPLLLFESGVRPSD
jgi:hypothetical protein